MAAATPAAPPSTSCDYYPRNFSRHQRLPVKDDEVALRHSRAEQNRYDLPLCHPWLQRSWLLCGISSGVMLIGVVLLLAGTMAAGSSVTGSGLSVVYAGLALAILAVIGYVVFGWLFNAARQRLKLHLEQTDWQERRSSGTPRLSLNMASATDVQLQQMNATRDRGRPTSHQQGMVASRYIPPLANGYHGSDAAVPGYRNSAFQNEYSDYEQTYQPPLLSPPYTATPSVKPNGHLASRNTPLQEKASASLRPQQPRASQSYDNNAYTGTASRSAPPAQALPPPRPRTNDGSQQFVPQRSARGIEI